MIVALWRQRRLTMFRAKVCREARLILKRGLANGFQATANAGTGPQ